MRNSKKLASAVAEAKRFLKAASEIQSKKIVSYGGYHDAGPKLTGAARRASMDLTRSLAELRKP